MKWAHEQALPDSETKLLLLVLANYAGHDDSCWPSIKRLARECILSERTIQYKIRVLQEMGLLKVSIRKNEEGDQTSNIYTLLAPPGASLAPPPVQALHHPGASAAPKPVIGTSNKNQVLVNWEELIYQAYPKHVGKPVALKAIGRQLKNYTAEFLMAKTEAYAAAVKGCETQFIPHPSTWFNQERFNDDPSTWERKGSPSLQTRTYRTIMDEAESKIKNFKLKDL